MKYFIYNSLAFEAYLKESSHVRGEVRFLRLFAEEGMVAVDIGGKIGVTTVTIAKEVGKRGKVYTFEPVPENFEVLKRNLTINGLRNVKALQLAVSDRVGKVDFYGNSIIPREEAQKTSVKATTLDALLAEEKLERMDLINMDCEGSELLVLRGAERILRKNKVKIFFEVHHDFLGNLGQSVGDIVEYLRGLGFQAYGVSLDDLSLKEEIERPEYVYAVK